MTDDQTPDHVLLRVRDVITDATARLTPEDREHRIAYCIEHDQHGVRMHLTEGDDLIEFRWGGKSLALVPRELLFDDGPLPVPDMDAELPDTIPPEWMER